MPASRARHYRPVSATLRIISSMDIEPSTARFDANFSPIQADLNAHVGMLVPLDHPPDLEKPRTQHDWRIGVSRQTGRLSLHAFLTGGGPGRDYYRDHYHSRTRLVFGLSYPL